MKLISQKDQQNPKEIEEGREGEEEGGREEERKERERKRKQENKI